MTEANFCDYCQAECGKYLNLRAVDFDDNKAIVKAWCGNCEPPDDINPDAEAAFMQTLEGQGWDVA